MKSERLTTMQPEDGATTPLMKLAQWILEASQDRSDPFEEDFLKAAEKACAAAGLDFQLLEPDLDRETYRDADGGARWDVEIAPGRGAGTRLEVVRKGIVIDGEVMARPQVRLRLAGLPAWESLPKSGPEDLHRAFERLASLYERYLADEALGLRGSTFTDVLVELRSAQKALGQSLADGTADRDWAHFINHDVARWLAERPGREVTVRTPDEARALNDPSHLLPLPRGHAAAVNGFVIRRRGAAEEAEGELFVVPAIGNPGPPDTLRAVLAAFEASELPEEAVRCLRKVQEDGDDVWRDRLLAALIQTYLVAERIGTQERTLRHLARQLVVAGVVLTELGKPCPGSVSESLRTDCRWDAASSGTVLEIRQTGVRLGEEVLSDFEGTLSLGPPPYLWSWLAEQSDAAGLLPDLRLALTDRNGFLEQLALAFFERYASYPVQHRLRLARRIVDGHCELPHEVEPWPAETPRPWSVLSARERWQALGNDPAFEVTCTPHPSLNRSDLDLLPGLKYAGFQTLPILDVRLPVEAGLFESLQSLDVEETPLVRRIIDLVMQIRARNVIAGELPRSLDGSGAERARLRDQLRDGYRDLHGALRRDPMAQEWRFAQVIHELLAPCADDGTWLPVRAVRVPGIFAADSSPQGDDLEADFEFSAEHPFGHLLRGLCGLEVAGDVAVPPLGSYSLGNLPQELSPHENWLKDVLSAFGAGRERFGALLESSRSMLSDLRAEGSGGRRRFVAAIRFLEDRCSDVRLLDEIKANGSVTVQVTEEGAPRPLLDQEAFLPGLALGERILLAPAGEAQRRAHDVEMHLKQALNGLPEAGQVEEIFHQTMGDLDQLPHRARLELFKLYVQHGRFVDEETATRLLASTPYWILVAGDRLPEKLIDACHGIRYEFSDKPAGTIRAADPYTVFHETDWRIELQADLVVSCGPRGSCTPRLLSLLRDQRLPDDLKERIRDIENRIHRCGPTADYPLQMASLLLELVKVLFEPDCLYVGDRRTLQEIFEDIAREGFWTCEPGDKVRTIHVANAMGELETAVRPAIRLSTPSETRDFEGVEIINHRPPSSLSGLWRNLDATSFRADSAGAVKGQVARSVLAHLDSLDITELSEWARGFEPQRIADLDEYCGLALTVDPQAAKAPERPAIERPWSLYSPSPTDLVSIHQAGYRLGDECRPLVWSRSLGPLPTHIESYEAARLLIDDFFSWFMPAFEAEMTEVLVEGEPQKNLRQLIAKWHQEIILDLVNLTPTTLVARVHRNIYQTMERWGDVPDSLRLKTLRSLRKIYQAIENAYNLESDQPRKPRITLIQCEPGQLIDHANHERFETVEGKSPHRGMKVEPIACGLEIRILGRLEIIKGIVSLTNKRTFT